MSLNRLLLELIRLTDRSAWPEYLPAKKGDIRTSVADIRAAREDLGYAPRISLTEGLRETIASYRERAYLPAGLLLPEPVMA